MKAVIVGGGIGGLSAAIALRRHGIDVVVLEKASADREAGAGLQVTPNATRLLDRAGVLDSLRTVAVHTQHAITRRWQDGAEVTRVDLGDVAEAKYGAPLLHFHRADLVAKLAECLPPETVRLHAEGVHVQYAAGGAVVKLADGSSEAADVVIGADGQRSTIRTLLFGPMPLRFSGKVVFRGLIPGERVPELIASRAMSTWFGPDGHLVQTFAGPDFVNIGMAFSGPENPNFEITTQVSSSEVLETMPGWDPGARRLVTLVSECVRWPVYDLDPLPQWSSGNVVLIGDAAHPMLPFMGQGASQAIEDGFAIASCLATGGSIAEGLARYRATRAPRATRVQAGARSNSVTFHLRDPEEQRERNDAWATKAPDVGTRMMQASESHWVYSYDLDEALRA